MVASLKVLFLGPPLVERNGAAVAFDSRKAMALLAYLALTNQPQRREGLASLLWPEYEQAKAYANLRRTLWSLKRGIGERRLAIDSETVVLRREDDVWLDVAAFREALAVLDVHSHESAAACAVCLGAVQTAVALYRDDFLAGFTLADSPAFDEWQFFESEGLRQAMARALQQGVRIHTARGAFAEAIEQARRWLALDPLHEPAQRAVMRLYAETGQRAAALRQYETCVHVLEQELGVPPEATTTQLYETIQANRLSAPSPETSRTPLPTLASTADAHRHNLPAQRTSFVGREREVARIGALLHRPDVRLVTLTGPAGSGKTRLALQVAQQALAAFADGVFFVDLAPVSEPGLVASAIARALDSREGAAQSLKEHLKRYLRPQHLLLLLDNFEQVVAAAPLLAELLDAAPHLKILVTSREVLHLYGEWEFPVPPLVLPAPQQVAAAAVPVVATLGEAEALRLFVARAQAVNPTFTLEEANARAVAELCIRLEGLPLAIELAAARSKLFGPQALLTRLTHRLDLLAGGARNLPARQRTLRGAIQWSYELLDESEQRLFARLGVFVGGATLEAVEAVCNANRDLPLAGLELLASLVDKSLLRPLEGRDGEPRFGMLETLRAYALERLNDQRAAEIAALHEAHARYYLALAEAAEPELSQLSGTDPTTWLARLQAEHDNLHAALDWSLAVGNASGTAVGLRLAGALLRFWELAGLSGEGSDYLTALLARPAAGGRSRVRARALHAAGRLAYNQGDYQAARSLLDEGLTLFRDLRDKQGIARSLRCLERLRWPKADGSGLQEALAIYREVGDTPGVAWSLAQLGWQAWCRGDATQVMGFGRESLTLFREVGNKVGIINALALVGTAARLQGDEEQAMARFEECLALCRALGEKENITYSLILLAGAAVGQGDYVRATTLLDESFALSREIGQQTFLAWSQRLLGTVALLQGDATRALELHRQSLRRYQAIGDRWGITECLEGLAQIAVRQGQQGQSGQPFARAARLFGAAETERTASGYSMWPDDRARCDQAVAAARARGGELVERAWVEGQALSLEQAIHYALAGEEEQVVR